MRVHTAASTVTVLGDTRVTSVGRILRRLKLDELPQLVNVTRGQMAFVGPRPDVAGFADALLGADRNILDVRPGITGPATLLLRDEERLLNGRADPEAVNRAVLFPMKTMINKAWIAEGTLLDDLEILLWTIFGVPEGALLQRIDRWDPAIRKSDLFGEFGQLSGGSEN